ncbi:MAG: replicative DNA helicase [Clostridia bacterium]|nr:replicative DNA helicase [Clostridia bacterium]
MNENIISRMPPSDSQAEQAVLGSMLVDKDAILTVIDILKPEDFYRPEHQEIYSAMLDLTYKNEPVDLLTLKSQLELRGKYDTINGFEYLVSLNNPMYSIANVESYAKIVEEKSILRKLISSSNEIARLSYEENEEAIDILDKAEKNLFAISEGKSEKTYSFLKDTLGAAIDNIQEMADKKDNLVGLTSGFKDLDDKTLGFCPGQLIIVAARPAMGKSAFMLNMATNAALKADAAVVYFSLEMSKEELTGRILASEALIDSQKIRNGKLDDEDWISLTNATGTLANAKILLDDSVGYSPMELRARCRRLKMEHDIKLIVIDYLQLMNAGKASSSRQQDISDISRSLKMLAKEIGVPIIAASQLSRAPEQRDEHRPMLADLRESGSIEQDADMVMFIYRDEVYNQETDKKNVAEIILAKNRAGSIGTVELAWLGQFTKFANLDKYR